MLGLGLAVKETLPYTAVFLKTHPHPPLFPPYLKSFRYLCCSFPGPLAQKGKKQQPWYPSVHSLVDAEWERWTAFVPGRGESISGEATRLRLPPSCDGEIVNRSYKVTADRCLAYPSVRAPPYLALLPFACTCLLDVGLIRGRPFERAEHDAPEHSCCKLRGGRHLNVGQVSELMQKQSTFSVSLLRPV